MSSENDRPRYAISADRQSASRRVRYIETNRPDDGSCTLCRLDNDNPPPEKPAMTDDSSDDESFSEARLSEAVENQIASDNPPAARATLNKLTLVGYERADAIRLMALILACEIENMLAEDRAFDVEGYERMLRALPELPEGLDDDEDQ